MVKPRDTIEKECHSLWFRLRIATFTVQPKRFPSN